MRVLQVFEPPDGGVAEIVGRLACGLGAEGVAVEVAGPPEALPYERLAAAGVPVHKLAWERAGHDRDRVRVGRTLRDLVALLRSGRFDLVHTHSAKAGVLGRVAAAACRVPAVHSPHCLPFEGDVSGLRRSVAATVEQRLGARTAALLCVCEHERALARAHRLAPASRVRLVHYGTPVVDSDGPVDERLQALRGEGVLAGAVCVLREQKGLEYLLRAAPLVLRELPESRIAIVGNGPLRSVLEAQAAALGLDADPRFAMLDFIGPSALHLRALDTFVLPSLWEALPIGVLEAMACGVPQIATAVAGTPEAVTPLTGRLVAPRDPGALAAATIELLRDHGLRRRLSSASRAMHCHRFAVARMVGETAGVYRSLLPAQRPDPVVVEPALHVPLGVRARAGAVDDGVEQLAAPRHG